MEDKFLYYGKSAGDRGRANPEKTVFNPNTMSPTPENLMKTAFTYGVDSDGATADGFPQRTTYGHIVPPRKGSDMVAPRVLATEPPDQTFFNGSQLLNSGIRVWFTEAVVNADALTNYALQSSGSIGDLRIVSAYVSQDRNWVQLEFAYGGDGYNLEDQFLSLLFNPPDGLARTPIADDSGNVLRTEEVRWYMEQQAPWLETVTPDPQVVTLRSNSFDWFFTVQFSEYMPIASEWGAESQWVYTLKASGGQAADLSVPLRSVEALDYDMGEFGPDDGFLKIGITTEDPFTLHQLQPEVAALYDELHCHLPSPWTMTDRAGNSLQPNTTTFVWAVEWVSSDMTAPTAIFLDPNPSVVNYIGNVARASDTSLFTSVRSVTVAFDEEVVEPEVLSNWNINAGSGLVLTDIEILPPTQAHPQKVKLWFEANAPTTVNNFVLSHFLKDAAGNSATSLASVEMDSHHPQLHQTGAPQGVFHLNSPAEGVPNWDGKVDIRFTTAVKHMELGLATFWNNGAVSVYTIENGVETPATDVVAQVSSVEEKPNSYPGYANLPAEQQQAVGNQIWAHTLTFELLTSGGSPISYGDQLYRIRITPDTNNYEYDSDLRPSVPSGLPSDSGLAQEPGQYAAGWGNPLSTGVYSDVFEDVWSGVVYVDVQNHTEPVDPLEVLAITPSEGEVISNDSGVVTLTFNQPITSISSVYVKVQDDNGDWAMFQPQEYVGVTISGSVAVLTYVGPTTGGGLYPAGLGVKFCVDGITLAADGSTVYGPWDAEYRFVDGNIAIIDLVKNDNKVTLSAVLGADVDEWRVKNIYLDGEETYSYMAWDWTSADTEVEIDYLFDSTGTYTITVEARVEGFATEFQNNTTVDYDYTMEFFYNVIYEQVDANQTPEPTKIDLAIGTGGDVPWLLRTGTNPTADYTFPIVENLLGPVSNVDDFLGLEDYAHQYSFTVDQPQDDALGQMAPGTYTFSTEGCFDALGEILCGAGPLNISFVIEQVGDTWFQHGRHGVKIAPAGTNYSDTCLLTLETPEGNRNFNGAFSHSITDSGKDVFIFGAFHWDVDDSDQPLLDSSYTYGNNLPNAQTDTTPEYVSVGVHKATFAWSSGVTEIMDIEIKDHGLHVVFNEIGTDGQVEVTVTEDDSNGKMDTVTLYEDLTLPIGGSAVMDVGATYTTSELDNGTYNYVIEGYSDTEENGAASPFAEYAMYRWEGTFVVQNSAPTVYGFDVEHRTDSAATYYLPHYNPNGDAPVEQLSTSTAGSLFLKFSPKADQETYTDPPNIYYRLEQWPGGSLITQGLATLGGEEIELGFSYNAPGTEHYEELLSDYIVVRFDMREADGVTIIGGSQSHEYKIDVLAPRYANTSSLSGAITQTYGSESGNDQYSVTNMWRFLSPEHSLYDESRHALSFHYNETMAAGSDTALNFPDPRTKDGWGSWARMLEWDKFTSDDPYPTQEIRNSAVDLSGNTQDDWTYLTVQPVKIDKPILVDVWNYTPEGTSDSSPQEYTHKGHFGGFIHMDGDVSAWTVDGDQDWSDTVARLTADFSFQVTGNSEYLPGPDHWKQYITDTHYEADYTGAKTVVLELHYSEPLYDSPEVTLHSEHFSSIFPWDMLTSGVAPSYFFGVPKPLRARVKMDASATYFDNYPVSTPWGDELKNAAETVVLHRANLDGATVASNEMCFLKLCEKGLSTATVDYNYYAGSSGVYDPPHELGSFSRVDRGDTREWLAGGVPGKILRVALNLEALWTEGKVSVLPIPGHSDMYGIPVCLEIRQKTGPAQTVLGPDYLTFWLLWGGKDANGVDLTEGIDWWAFNDVDTGDQTYWPNEVNSLGRTFGFSEDSFNLTKHANGVGFEVSRQAIVGYTPPVLLSSIVVTTDGGAESASLEEGSTLQLKATATYSDQTVADITNEVSWYSSVPSYASVVSDSGLVAGVLAVPNPVLITAQAGSDSDSFSVTVTAPSQATLTGLTISDAAEKLDGFLVEVGASWNFKALGTYSDSSSLLLGSDDGLHWSSSNEEAATVDASGKLFAHQIGAVILTAKVGDISTEVIVHVSSENGGDHISLDNPDMPDNTTNDNDTAPTSEAE